MRDSARPPAWPTSRSGRSRASNPARSASASSSRPRAVSASTASIGVDTSVSAGARCNRVDDIGQQFPGALRFAEGELEESRAPIGCASRMPASECSAVGDASAPEPACLVDVPPECGEVCSPQPHSSLPEAVSPSKTSSDASSRCRSAPPSFRRTARVRPGRATPGGARTPPAAADVSSSPSRSLRAPARPRSRGAARREGLAAAPSAEGHRRVRERDGPVEELGFRASG